MPAPPGEPYEEEHVDGADDGVLHLIERGCGGWCGLVVSGEARGRVVYLGDGPPHFVWDRTFLDWYERWVDELIAGLPVSWFGYTRGGSEAQLCAWFAASRFARERMEILASLGRSGPITSAAHGMLREALLDPEPKVRVAALHAMGRAGTMFDATLVEKLGDPDVRVRQGAVYALSNCDRIAPYIRELNAAGEREATSAAMYTFFWALEKVDGILLTALRPHVTSSDTARRRNAATFLGRTSSTLGLEGFERLLIDEDIHVRVYARDSFKKRGEAEARRWLAARIEASSDEVERAMLERALRSLDGEKHLV